MSFAVDDKVVHAGDPNLEMTVVEVNGDQITVSFKVDEKRKMKVYPAGELQKK